jgi:glutaminase
MPTPEVSRRVTERLEDMYRRQLAAPDDGVANYYAPGRGYVEPELALEQRDQFAISLAAADGDIYHAGDHELRFPLQSISKVFAYALALEDHGRDHVLQRVGVKPSGDAFNSIEFDERNNRPHNPMVNAGALATTGLVRGKDSAERLERILDLLRRSSGDEHLSVDEQTFKRELDSADRNRATAYLMRSQGMLTGDVEDTLTLYLRQCSVQVNCRDLAVMAATFANGGVNPVTEERVFTQRGIRDVLSVMYTCGMYDFAGEWAYEVGVPAKSGVSGGIMAVIPGKMGIGVFSPGLDQYGNSVRGVRVCQEVSERLGLHVFAASDEDRMLAAPAAEA